MTEVKTKATKASVDKFLKSIDDKRIRDDCYQILDIMKKVTRAEPKMWGESIIGFGSYHYKYASGREGDWMLTGFSPRKQNLTIYIMSGFEEYGDILNKLGKHSTSKSCLYIKKLEDVDTKVLKKLVSESVKKMKKMYK